MSSWLVYGAQGWLGSYICDQLRKISEITLLEPRSRANDPEGVSRDLDSYKPDRVISFIGRTRGPGCNTIDYLEDKLRENLRDNLYSPVVLMKLCSDRGIHFTYLGTGCIFSYENPEDPEFIEESHPNFFGSSYSTVKGFTDELTRLFPNTLNVRLRMPIIEYDCPQNFISKIVRYPKILNTLNSMTVLPVLLPCLIESIRSGRTGTINLINPEPTDHITILELYRKYIDPNHTYTLVTESEHDSMLKSKRSKNRLRPTFQVISTTEAIEKIFQSGTFVKPN